MAGLVGVFAVACGGLGTPTSPLLPSPSTSRIPTELPATQVAPRPLTTSISPTTVSTPNPTEGPSAAAGTESMPTTPVALPATPTLALPATTTPIPTALITPHTTSIPEPAPTPSPVPSPTAVPTPTAVVPTATPVLSPTPTITPVSSPTPTAAPLVVITEDDFEAGTTIGGNGYWQNA